MELDIIRKNEGLEAVDIGYFFIGVWKVVTQGTDSPLV